MGAKFGREACNLEARSGRISNTQGWSLVFPRVNQD